jgi:NAD(P)-dependent dehydrogenase (short-subunit alcohol dehydrogenase family)
MKEFEGKVIAITGAGGVILSCISDALAQEGAKVAVLDLNLAAAESVASAIRSKGGQAQAFACNVLDKASLIACKEQVNSAFGSVDILINGAGGNSPKATTDDEGYSSTSKVPTDFFALKEEGFRFVFDLNLTGAFLTTQVFAMDMLGRKGCSILNISSMNAYRPLTKIPAYSAAKAGVSNFTEWLATYFAKEGIRVNAIAPGFFLTNQNRGLLLDKKGEPTARAKKIVAATPMGRMGEVEELVGATEFLLDEKKSSFITGVILPIDGGFSAYSGV